MKFNTIDKYFFILFIINVLLTVSALEHDYLLHATISGFVALISAILILIRPSKRRTESK